MIHHPECRRRWAIGVDHQLESVGCESVADLDPGQTGMIRANASREKPIAVGRAHRPNTAFPCFKPDGLMGVWISE